MNEMSAVLKVVFPTNKAYMQGSNSGVFALFPSSTLPGSLSFRLETNE